MSAAAIILAAGESRRMGRPKALLPFRGGTFLSELAGTLGQYCKPVIAVFGFDGERLASQVSAPVIPVVNADYQLGMLTSLQIGLRAAPLSVDCVLFTLVDHPAIASATVRSLLDTQAEIAIPRYGGKRGHPVLVSRAVADDFAAEPVTSKVHDVINRHAASICYVDVPDRGVTDDIDDDALYRELLAREAALPE